MKKNLAKKIVLGLLTGAVLMSSSVAWADSAAGGSVPQGVKALAVGAAIANADGSIAIGANSSTATSSASTEGKDSIAIGRNASAGGYAHQLNDGLNGVAIGASAYVHGSNNVALGYGSYAGTESNVVSVGSGGNLNGDFPETRRIINVTAGVNATDAVNMAQLEAVKNIIGDGNVVTEGSGIGCITNGADLTATIRNLASALDLTNNIVNNSIYTESEVDNKLEAKADKATTLDGYGITDAYTKEQSDARYMKIAVSDNVDVNVLPTITVDNAGQMIFGTNSSWIDGDGEGFFAGRKDTNLDHTADNARASMTEDGTVTAEKFIIKGANNTEINVETELNKKADKESVYTKTEIDGMLGGSNASISGINQRLDKTNAKINKVGAGAAALAALHPLDYDPDDKLTFSAGMGNYAGENAAALGAFYRPNEKFMVSLGGTMGNGENMVNLGLSIGLDKASGLAKLSKRELIQEVNAVKAENEAIKADNEAMKAEMAEMKAMLQAILAKK